MSKKAISLHRRDVNRWKAVAQNEAVYVAYSPCELFKIGLKIVDKLGSLPDKYFDGDK